MVGRDLRMFGNDISDDRGSRLIYSSHRQHRGDSDPSVEGERIEGAQPQGSLEPLLRILGLVAVKRNPAATRPGPCIVGIESNGAFNAGGGTLLITALAQRRTR